MDRLEKLKAKYQTVLKSIQEKGVRLQNVHVQDNKLFVRGAAPSDAVKNKLWDQIKVIGTNVVRVGVALALTTLFLTGGALQGDSNPNRFEGVINDFSPPSTNPAGPYLVSGPWSLQLHPAGKANFDASLTMVRSTCLLVSGNPICVDEAQRNFHTHHVQMTDGLVSMVGTTLVVNGAATVTSNGSQPPVLAGSAVRIEISGGTLLAPTNIKLFFVGGAAGHFTAEPYDGVVLIR